MTTVPVPSAALTVGRQGNYAGAVSRLAAFAADVGASWGLYTLGVALLNAALKLVSGHSFTLSNHQLPAFIVLTLWEFLYFTYQWAVSGKTLGMAILGLQVVTREGAPISGRQAVFRTIGLGITLFLTVGIGFLGIVYQRDRRALNDYIAGTAVVYDWDARAARLRWIARKEGPAGTASDAPGAHRPRGPERSPHSTMPRMSFTEISRPHPHVAVVTLNRPERMNAMAFDVMIPFRDALREIGSDNDVRIVVITGAGRGFCSGADHENPGTMPNMEGLTLPTIALRSMELLDDVISTIRRLHQPVIAAVNGAAIGGGFCLALAADIRIASDEAYFRAAGINNGLTAAELGLSFLLPRSVGHSRAAEIMLTGRDVDASEADRIGLVSRVVPQAELLPACFELADRINGWGRAGVELTKRQLWNSLDASSLQSHMDAEGTSQLFVRITTRNFEESVAARKEGRVPDFKD